MAWFDRSTKQRPMTPWEQYQAQQKKQQRKHRKPKQKRQLSVKLPQVTQLRKHQLIRNVILLLLPLLVMLGIFGYFASRYSKVNTVDVRGLSTVPAQTVIDATKLSSSDLIFDVYLHRSRYVQRVKKAVPEIKSASVAITWPNNIVITAKEHQTIGYVVKGGQYYKLLATGTILKTGTRTPIDTYPVFSGFTGKELTTMIKLLSHFPAAVRHNVSEVSAARGGANPYQIILNMSDGNRIIADSRTLGQKIKYYPTIVSQVKNPGVIDLEVGAFYRPYASDEKPKND